VCFKIFIDLRSIDLRHKDGVQHSIAADGGNDSHPPCHHH